jgi:hypothetical protein
MQNDIASQTSEKITAMISRTMKTAKSELKIGLENVMDECEPQKLKLRLYLVQEGNQRSQMMSECLQLNDIAKIHEAVRKFCETKQIEYTMKKITAI